MARKSITEYSELILTTILGFLAASIWVEVLKSWILGNWGKSTIAWLIMGIVFTSFAVLVLWGLFSNVKSKPLVVKVKDKSKESKKQPVAYWNK